MGNDFKFPAWDAGDLIEFVCGIPGPDRELAIIYKIENNTYFFKFKVYGKGPWHEDKWVHNERSMYTPISARNIYPYYEEYVAEGAAIKSGQSGGE
ncbi:hypothetical protein [Mameliella alba]|uniref:Uncharacterized protein n=1 Tax=Mameliella alba TaxID=561184 RepID=A0A0B3S314_9RHOB|nr:hypothetical protein [Mameliella alba]KHQ51081.1 hypothetical protein OA50_04452 [Mameliella alba]